MTSEPEAEEAIRVRRLLDKFQESRRRVLVLRMQSHWLRVRLRTFQDPLHYAMATALSKVNGFLLGVYAALRLIKDDPYLM